MTRPTSFTECYLQVCEEERTMLRNRNIARAVLLVGCAAMTVGMTDQTHRAGWPAGASVALVIAICAAYLLLLSYQDKRFRRALRVIRKNKAVYSTLSAQEAMSNAWEEMR